MSPDTSPAARVRARVFSFGVLAALIGGFAYVGQQAYRAATDSFMAPIILSPDSDLVLANKLRDTQLSVEREKTAAEIAALDADIAAGQKATARLRSLDGVEGDSRAWLASENASLAAAGASEQKILGRQGILLAEMLEKQRELTREARANLEANLISKTDLARETQAESQLELALIENERARARGTLQVQQAVLAQRSLAGKAPSMPELIVRREQMVHLELELQKLESEARTKVVERRILVEKLAKIDEVQAQLRARPLFRASEKSIDVAFVPYTQLDGVHRGAKVYECLWGLVRCKPVGVVSEIVPGEVMLPDPWGNQARGQYAVLDLRDPTAARAKMLRVRGPGAPSGTGAPGAPDGAALSRR